MRTDDQILADAADESAFSNHTEYEYWADGGRGCYDCTQDNPDIDKYCPILSVALLGKWPTEWTRKDVPWQIGDASGVTVHVDECTEFERRLDDGPDDDEPEPDPTPGPVAEIDGQIDMFEVFAEKIADEAGAVRAEVTAP